MADAPILRVGFDGTRATDHQTLVIRTADGQVRVLEMDEVRAALQTMTRRIRGFLVNGTKALRRYSELATRVARARIDQLNDPVRVAGLEARYWVRAGMDPRYRDLTALDQLVDDILNAADPDLRYLRPDNLRAIAAAAAAGWLESYVPRTAAALHREGAR